MTKLQQVYLLKDNDLNIYKIGRRTIGTPRFLTKGSLIKNGYPTDIEQLQTSTGLSGEDTNKLEKVLQDMFTDKNVTYPPVVVTVCLDDGEPISINRRPNGHTEWYKLNEEDVNEVMDILSHS